LPSLPDSAKLERRVDLVKWGLIPAWAKDPAIANNLINARGESVAEKPSFRSAFKLRRCLVLADGFYEWRKIGDRKQPYHIGLQGGEPFGIAGLWERWTVGDPPVETCTLITTDANPVVAKVHNRMPVILSPDDYDRWLDPERKSPDDVLDLLRPYPAERMAASPVSTLVNNPRNERRECIEPVDLETIGEP
jgi:putative SOS response-associated peptidase YedK